MKPIVFQRWVALSALLLLSPGVPVIAQTGFTTAFDSDPVAGGWRAHGDGSLFQWEADAGRLAVLWDSSRSNSYFAHPLPAPVTSADDFRFGFELELVEHAVGVDPAKPGTFQIALGLIRLADATAPGFQRAVVLRSSNLVEWTSFASEPGGAISASISPVIIPRDGRLPWGYGDSYMTLETGVRYGFEYHYIAAQRTLRSTVTVDGLPGPDLVPVILPPTFKDFQVDALSVNSYSDAGQDPRYAGSVRARGWIHRLHYEGPGPAVESITLESLPAGWRVSTASRKGWTYRLLHSPDLKTWTHLGLERAGTGGILVFDAAAEPEVSAGFLRIETRIP